MVYVLEQIYKLDMTCFEESPADTTLSYTQIFVNHILVECRDCGYAFIPEGVTEEEEETLSYILLENSTNITLEDNSGSLLMET